jgi:hypothetical protein
MMSRQPIKTKIKLAAVKSVLLQTTWPVASSTSTIHLPPRQVGGMAQEYKKLKKHKLNRSTV